MPVVNENFGLSETNKINTFFLHTEVLNKTIALDFVTKEQQDQCNIAFIKNMVDG